MQPIETGVYLETTSRQGHLVITEERVILRRGSGRRALWSLPREEVVGTSSYQARVGRTMLLHLSDGGVLRLDAVPGRDALAVVALLGYARMLLPRTEKAAWVRNTVRTRLGRLRVTPDSVQLRSRINPFAKPHWQAPLSQVTGISSRRTPGLRMEHEVRLHTSDGQRLNLGSLPADRTIALTRTLGHVAAMPQVPDFVASGRAALWERIEPGSEGAPEAERFDGPQQPRLSRSARHVSQLSLRELRTGSRIASMVAVALLGAYLAAAIVTGRSLAYAAPFFPASTEPQSAQPADIIPGGASPTTPPSSTTSGTAHGK